MTMISDLDDRSTLGWNIALQEGTKFRLSFDQTVPNRLLDRS